MAMDDHTVVLTIEWHAMAESPAAAVERVLENIKLGGVGPADLWPMCMSIDVDGAYSRKEKAR